METLQFRSLGRNLKQRRKRFEDQSRMFRNVLNKHLSVIPDIVAIENDIEGQELDRSEEISWCTKIFDDETLQPKNLFDSCIDMFKRNEDGFGQIAFNAVFSKENHNPKKGHIEVKAKNSINRRLNEQERTFLEYLQISVVGELIEDGSLMIKAGEEFILSQTLNQDEVANIRHLIKQMNDYGIDNPNDLRFMTVETLKHILRLDLDQTQSLFVMNLGLKKSESSYNDLDDGIGLIGNGYNILQDVPTDPEIFQYELRDTKRGVKVPSPAKFSRVRETMTIMENYDSAEDMNKARLRHLNVDLEVDPKSCVTTKAGFNYESKSSTNTSDQISHYSYFLEQRWFQISMANFRKCTFTDDFRSDVWELPGKFDISDKKNREDFEKFFGRWGHVVITSVYGGGSVELDVIKKGSKLSTDDLSNIKSELDVKVKGMNMGVSFTSGCGQSNSSNVQNVLGQCSIIAKWKGGHESFQNNTTLDDQRKMEKWKASIMNNHVLLRTDMSTTPISILVERVDSGRGKACYSALQGTYS